MTPSADIDNVIRGLVEIDADLDALLAEHLKDNEGELLRTVFLSDVARWAASPSTRQEAISAVCDRLEAAYVTGDNVDQDIIGTGFVESLPAVDEPGGFVIALLPPSLHHVAADMNLTEPWHS